MSDLIVIIVTCAIAFCIYHYGIKPKRKARRQDNTDANGGGAESGGIPTLDVSGMGLGLNNGIYSSLARYGGGIGANSLYMPVPPSPVPSPVRLRFQLALLELAESKEETGGVDDLPENAEDGINNISEATVRRTVVPAVERILAALYNRGAYGVRLSFVPIGCTKLMVAATYELSPSEM